MTWSGIDDRRIELGTEFHEAWIEIAKRGRFGVLEAMGAKLCKKQPGAKVTVRVECQYLDREGHPKRAPEVFGGFDLCEIPEI